MITRVASVIPDSIAASVSGVMLWEFGMRLSHRATPGIFISRRHSCSMVWSVASTISPILAR